MKLTRLTAAVLAGAAAFAVSPAFAGNATGSINVGLTVTDDCTIATNDIDFGSTGIVESNIDTSADITIECTKGTAYAIGLDGGSTGNNTAARKMTAGGADTVNYQLYSNAGYSTVWGNTVGADTVDSPAATGGPPREQTPDRDADERVEGELRRRALHQPYEQEDDRARNADLDGEPAVVPDEEDDGEDRRGDRGLQHATRAAQRLGESVPDHRLDGPDGGFAHVRP